MKDWIPVFVQIIIGAVAIWKMYKTHAWEAAEKTEQAVSSMAVQIGEIKTTLQTHIDADSENDAKQARSRVLRFADECRRGELHSKEFFDSVLDDIDLYEKFCKSHPKFENNKTVASNRIIKDLYEKCVRENKFI